MREKIRAEYTCKPSKRLAGKKSPDHKTTKEDILSHLHVPVIKYNSVMNQSLGALSGWSYKCIPVVTLHRIPLYLEKCMIQTAVNLCQCRSLLSYHLAVGHTPLGFRITHCNRGACRQLPCTASNYTPCMTSLSKSAARCSHVNGLSL